MSFLCLPGEFLASLWLGPSRLSIADEGAAGHPSSLTTEIVTDFGQRQRAGIFLPLLAQIE